MANSAALPDGLVETKQYDELLQSDLFKEVEVYSNAFIEKVGPMIQSYNIRWVPDPFHQWSRQWEYLYIIDKARGMSSDAQVVDLGAGVSFLPYYLKEKVGLKNILALDYDPSLKNLYEKVNATIGQPTITFQDGDMRNLQGIANESVDFAYSVSVLEHTDSYDTVIKEIHRILKPGALLSLTFDISLDGLDDIPLQRAHELLASLERIFGVQTGLNLDEEISKQNLVTSGLMAQRNKALMPWKYPSINIVKHLIKHGKPGKRYKDLTFCCVSVKKNA